MKQKKILLTGGGGLLGQFLNAELAGKSSLLSLYHSHPPVNNQPASVKVDITRPAELHDVFEQFQPDIVIHLAAVSNPAKANALTAKDVFSINVAATETIALLAAQYKARLIYTSTDLVYAGYRGSMLREDAKLIPATLYAETKLMGERKIQAVMDDYIILRTALLYGIGLSPNRNFFNLMVAALSSGIPVDVFIDQWRTPLFLREAARIIRGLIDKEITGVIANFAGTDRVSRADIGDLVCESGGFDQALLNRVTMSDRPDVVPVADVSLNTGLLQSFGMTHAPIEECVREAILHYKERK